MLGPSAALQKPWTYKQAKTKPEDMASRCKPGDTQKRHASPSKANPAGLLGTGGPSVRKSLQQTNCLSDFPAKNRKANTQTECKRLQES